MIQAKDVAQLRRETGAGMMDAKKALETAQGDFEKARTILQESFLSKADKKADRDTSEGVIGHYIHNRKLGIMVSLACETDFVARNEQFQQLAENIALHIAALGSEYETIDHVLESQYIKDPSLSIADLIKSHIATLGENIQLKTFVRISL